MRIPRLLIFDFDGTLVDSTAGILHCIEQTVAALALPAAAVDVWRDMIGLPLAVQLEHLLPPARRAEVEAGVELYRSFYRQLPPEQLGVPYPGVRELLDYLAPRAQLAIASSKGRAGLTLTLGTHGWEDLFDPVISPADVGRPKPHPESLLRVLAHHGVPCTEAVYLGDSRFDMEMSVAARVPAWGAAWGVHDAITLRRAGATRCFASPQVLLEELRRLEAP